MIEYSELFNQNFKAVGTLMMNIWIFSMVDVTSIAAETASQHHIDLVTH